MDKEELIQRGKELFERLKHGGHANQKIHGNRYGQSANLTLDRARSLRKSGDLQKYIDKSRGMSGSKPSKVRQAESGNLKKDKLDKMREEAGGVIENHPEYIKAKQRLTKLQSMTPDKIVDTLSSETGLSKDDVEIFKGRKNWKQGYFMKKKDGSEEFLGEDKYSIIYSLDKLRTKNGYDSLFLNRFYLQQ